MLLPSSGGGVRLDYVDTGLGTPGWYRAYAIEGHRAYGYYGEFCIATVYNNSTNAVIIFSVLITHSKVKINILETCGPVDVIDKIRITRFSNDEEQYRIDIHYGLSSSNNCVFKNMQELRGNTIFGNTFYYAFYPMDEQPAAENVITTVDITE